MLGGVGQLLQGPAPVSSFQARTHTFHAVLVDYDHTLSPNISPLEMGGVPLPLESAARNAFPPLPPLNGPPPDDGEVLVVIRHAQNVRRTLPNHQEAARVASHTQNAVQCYRTLEAPLQPCFWSQIRSLRLDVHFE